MILDQNLSAENQRLLTNAQSMKTEWEAYRDTHLKDSWDRYNKFEMGDQWYDTQLEDWQSPIVINHCRKIKYWYLSLLTDQPAKLAVYGREQGDYEKPMIGQDPQTGQPKMGMSKTERMDKMVRYLWDSLYMENRRMTAWDYALTYSVGWFKPHINIHKQFWTGDRYIPGDVDVAVIDPWFVGVDPGACWSANPVEILDTAEYMIHYVPRSIRWLKRTYPKFEEQIEALGGATDKDFSPWHFRGIDKDGKTRDEFLPQANAAGTTTNTGGNWTQTPYKGEHIYSGKQVMVAEVYMRDTDYGKVCVTLVENLLLNVRGGGRHVHSERVCDGGEYPYQHGQFPFIPYVCHPRPGKLYGYGILDILISPQEVLNKMLGQILDIKNVYKSPVLAIEDGSIDISKIAYAPGAKLPYKPGSNPPQILQPNLAFNNEQDMIHLMTNVLQELGGINESIMSGNIKAGTPGVAVEGMIEQAMQRIRLLERYNYAANKMLGRQMMSIMQQRYQYTGIEARVLGEGGDPQSMLLAPDDWMGQYDFEVIPGSALALKKAEWFKKAMDLNAIGKPMPTRRYVEYAGFPDTEAVTNDMEQEFSLQQQVEMLQQENEELKSQVAPQMPPMAGGQM